MTKLQKSGTNWFLSIPKCIVEGLSWQKGDSIGIKISGKNTLVLSKRLELLKE
jgi:antitoxin component of MazEF toxin-antitoxin module